MKHVAVQGWMRMNSSAPTDIDQVSYDECAPLQLYNVQLFIDTAGRHVYGTSSQSCF